MTLLVGPSIDCWYTHTGLRKVTDAGMKAFSAALGSSTTITTVGLDGKYKWLVCLAKRALLCMRLDVRSVGGCDGIDSLRCVCVRSARQ